MYNRILILTAVIIAALFLPSAGANAQPNVPIVQADTIFAGFGGGSVSGIVFGPTGETVILMHDAQPVEIDIKTKQVLREFEKVPNRTGGGGDMFTVRDKGKLFAVVRSSELYGIKDFAGEIVWDLESGKILETINGIKLLAENDKDKYYFYGTNGTIKEYLGKFDIKTSKMVDSIYLPKTTEGAMYAQWGAIGIIPNTNKVLLALNRYNEYTQGQKEYILAELYFLDFDTKKYTKIPIPYESGQKSSEITSITVSKTGTNNIITIKVIGKGYYFYIYDNNFNYVEKVLYDSIKYNNYPVGFGTNITFIDDRYIVSNFYNGATKVMVFDIVNKEIKLVCPFYTHAGVDTYNNIIVMADNLGRTAIIDVEPISVEDSEVQESNVVTYKDSNLVINSTVNERLDLEVVDYNGNMLFTKKDLLLHSGLNTVKTNLPLVNGIYFCILKTNKGSITYKFIVAGR